MKGYIKIIIYAVTMLTIGVLLTFSIVTDKHCRSLKVQTKEQSKIIDSLLNRRMKVVDCSLNVTDKSKFIIYGKYNKGTITAPSEQTYTLKIDSTSVTIK